MNAKVIRKLDMLKRVIRFLSEILITLPRAEAARAEIIAIITAIEAAARDQVGGAGETEGGVDLRESIARDLREHLKAVNRTARTLEAVNVGMHPTFRLPKSGSYPALIATAQNIITAAETMEAEFIEAGMSVDFLSELNGLLNSFKEATRRKISGKLSRIKSTAALDTLARLGVIAATKLDAYARNYFRGNPEILAAWSHARHIQRAPVRHRATTTETVSEHSEEEKPGTLKLVSDEKNENPVAKIELSAPHAPNGGVDIFPPIAHRSTPTSDASARRDNEVPPPTQMSNRAETRSGESLD